MTDWRTNPRTGKSQFFPLIDEIRNRLSRGETNKQIHDDLTTRDRIKIGYDQFARYIRKLNLKDVKEKTAEVVRVTEPVLSPDKPSHPFDFTKSERNGERRREQDFHSSVPDKERIYGVSKNTEPH